MSPLRVSLVAAACASVMLSSCGGATGESPSGDTNNPGGESVGTEEASCGGSVCAAELEDAEETDEPSP